MKNTFKIVQYSPLLDEISNNDFERLVRCLDAVVRSYEKGGVILLSGDRVDHIGLIVSGRVKIIREDRGGNITILTELGAPELFGEVFACAGVGHSPVTVQASETCEILFLNYRKVVTSCPSACPFHTRLIENMLKLVAQKNLLLYQKVEILSRRTTREKLLALFDMQRGGADKFTIPYNREEMAQFLCVDRSAMSNELCKMRDDGLIRFNRNEFEIC